MEQGPSGEANSHQLVKKFTAFYGTRSFITVFLRGPTDPAESSPYPHTVFV